MTDIIRYETQHKVLLNSSAGKGVIDTFGMNTQNKSKSNSQQERNLACLRFLAVVGLRLMVKK